MACPWEQDFDSYTSTMADAPITVTVDLGAGPHVPVESHNVRLRLMVQMQNPLPDGLRSPGEDERLLALEETLRLHLSEQVDGVMVGRVTVRGVTDLVFYAPGTAVGQIDLLRALVDQLRDDYEIDIDVAPDVTWEFYRQVLWPDEDEYERLQSNRAEDEPAPN